MNRRKHSAKHNEKKNALTDFCTISNNNYDKPKFTDKTNKNKPYGKLPLRHKPWWAQIEQIIDGSGLSPCGAAMTRKSTPQLT